MSNLEEWKFITGIEDILDIVISENEEKRIFDLPELVQMRQELEECKDAIEIKDRYIDGHKGEMTSLNRENIQLRADLARTKKICDNCGPFYFRDMNLELGLAENSDLDEQMKKVKQLKTNLARTQRALELACEKLSDVSRGTDNVVTVCSQNTWEQIFLAQADHKETP